MRGGYEVAPNPSSTREKYPVLVLDGNRRLHIPLTVFAKEARSRVDDKTARQYLSSILQFFHFLDTDESQLRAGRTWDAEPKEIRIAVTDYLNQHYRCKVRQHRLGFQLVTLTAGTQSTVRVFLAGLKLYYQIASEREMYTSSNPLQDRGLLAAEVAAQRDDPSAPPRMPDISGVVAPRPRQRLSDSYFRLQGAEWKPQIVDDPTLPAHVLRGGRSLKGWRLREDCITRLLFESGARVSEILGLTLGDWARRNLLQEATAFSKGSHGRRVKFVRFSADTAKLIHRYFDTDRRRLDPRGFGVAEYLRAAEAERVDLFTVPLFLSARRRRLSKQTYRQEYWNPACRAAGIDADIHQARHWYVTMAIREIYETSRDAAEIQRRKRELMEYMGWKSGEEILAVYEHYFDAVRHAEVQDRLHAQMAAAVQRSMTAPRRRRSPPAPVAAGRDAPAPVPVTPEDAEFEFLRGFGGGDGDTGTRQTGDLAGS